MEGLLDLIADNISDEMLFDMLEEAIKQYRVERSQRSKEHITFISSMVLRREIIEKVGHEKLNEHRQAFNMGERILNAKN